jgi:Calcineurin-like phosphoesterase
VRKSQTLAAVGAVVVATALSLTAWSALPGAHPAAQSASPAATKPATKPATQPATQAAPAAQTADPDVRLPLKNGSTRFAVLGDTGTGEKPQYEVGQKVEEYRQKTGFAFSLMLGDNIYGSERPQDFGKKFELPYKALLDAGVKFYATLGNHDDPNQRFYKPFNMNGERYYTYTQGNIRFFVLDSNYLDRKQLDWFEGELKSSGSDWKMAYFHHPLYSSGAAHGSETDLRALLEPLFVKYGVNVVFAGHEHFYERVKPQQGIYYFTCGGAAQLREGNIKRTNLTEVGFDTDRSFMIVEVAGDDFYFQTISRTGKTVDTGSIHRSSKH